MTNSRSRRIRILGSALLVAIALAAISARILRGTSDAFRETIRVPLPRLLALDERLQGKYVSVVGVLALAEEYEAICLTKADIEYFTGNCLNIQLSEKLRDADYRAIGYLNHHYVAVRGVYGTGPSGNVGFDRGYLNGVQEVLDWEQIFSPERPGYDRYSQPKPRN